MKNKILKKLANIFGYKLVDKNHIKNERILEKHTYLNTERILDLLFKQKKIKYLIQIGANDGLRFDDFRCVILNEV